MRSALKRRVVMTAQSQKIVDDLHGRIAELEAENTSLSEALAETEKKGAEVERLRFEGDLDRWMKTLGAGISGYQPEAYAVMDAACAELAKLRTEVEKLRNPWSTDMQAIPRGEDVVVYQPPHKAGRTTPRSLLRRLIWKSLKNT